MDPASRRDFTWTGLALPRGAESREGVSVPLHRAPAGARVTAQRGSVSAPDAKQAIAPHDPGSPPDGRAVPAPTGQGDILGAFERLFLREYARVVTAAYRVLGDRLAAEDAAQEAFLSFQRRYPADAPFAAAWLHAAAVHEALNQLRGERRRQRREEHPAAGEGPAAGTADPARLVEAAETREEVRRALARMAPRNAAVLVLRYSGLSYAEIAAALGVPTNQVGTLLRRAEAILRKELHDVAPG